MSKWKKVVPANAIANGNISMLDCPFNILPYVGGSSEAERAKKDLTVHFENSSTEKMWIYGQSLTDPEKNPKWILTDHGRSAVHRFFAVNGIDGSRDITLEIEEHSPGTLSIRKV